MQYLSCLGMVGVIAGLVLLGLEQQYRFLPDTFLGLDPVWWICGLSGLWFLSTLAQIGWAHFHRPDPESVQCHQCFWTGSPAVWESAGGCPRCHQSGDYSYLIFGPGQVLRQGPADRNGRRPGLGNYRHRVRL
jgi:hypothetical protein